MAFKMEVTAFRVDEPTIIGYPFLSISTVIGDVVRVEGGEEIMAKVKL